MSSTSGPVASSLPLGEVEVKYVTFDSNVYRALRASAFQELQKLELSQTGLTPVASPVVLLELVSKLAGREEDTRIATTALRRLASHCSSCDGMRVFADADATLGKFLFDRVNEQLAQSVAVVARMVQNLARLGPSDPLPNDAVVVARKCAEHVSQTEASFVEGLRGIVALLGCQQWDSNHPRPELDEPLRRALASAEWHRAWATMHVERVAKLVGHEPTGPEMDRLTQAVVTTFPVAREFYATLLHSVVVAGVDAAKNKRANYFWDYYILFALPTQANADMLLVTGDKAMRKAAARCEMPNSVVSVAMYKDDLEQRSRGER